VEGDGKPRATGTTRHACVNADGRVVRPPAFLREALDRAVGAVG
jgi:acyl-CoA thioesterase FadM